MRTHRLFSVFLAIILVFTLAPAVMAQDAPSVTAGDQESNGSQVTVDEVVAATDGWIVIHQDADGKPGPILGKTPVPAGTTENVIVVLDAPLTEDANLWAMLHVDEGEVGTFEFPDGPDVPVKDGDKIVMAPFMATVAGEEMADEEMAAEETMTEEEMPAEETASEEMAAPAQLPETGAAPNSLPITFAVTGALLAVLLGGVILSRRRM